MKNVIFKYSLFIAVLAVLELGFIGFGGYKYQKLSVDLKNNQNELASTTENLNGKIRSLETELATHLDEKTRLAQQLSSEQVKNNEYTSQIQSMQTSVNTLMKLNATDKEILQKYSKVFFLSENYVPAALITINQSELSYQKKTIQFHAVAWTHLQKMMTDANSANSPLLIVSAYRSFKDQTGLKQNYKMVYGSGANQFSADQGYSEHQLGTAVDLTTPVLGASFEKIEKTPSYKWLSENAYKYGFVLSYPKNNSYYQFEPWHWRFVGIRLATFLHDNKKNLYDLEQREIDQYLVDMFE